MTDHLGQCSWPADFDARMEVLDAMQPDEFDSGKAATRWLCSGLSWWRRAVVRLIQRWRFR